MIMNCIKCDKSDWKTDELTKPYILVFTKYECYIVKIAVLLVTVIAIAVCAGSLAIPNSFNTMTPTDIL